METDRLMKMVMLLKGIESCQEDICKETMTEQCNTAIIRYALNTNAKGSLEGTVQPKYLNGI